MKTFKLLGLPIFILLYVLSAIAFQSCEPEEDCDDEPQCDTCFMVKKPNIYIYPEEKLELEIDLNFPQGGKIIKSIPEYVNGWNVSVDSTGLIDNTYSFLFYESVQPNIWQKEKGWSVTQKSLDSFFRQNMKEYGFEGKEIEDFIEYWIPRLTEYSHYAIYPQTQKTIDDVIELNFSIQPESILRLFYVIEGTNYDLNIIVPEIALFARNGYYVTEWGVIHE